MTRNSLIVLGLVACAGSAFAVPFPEVEPNETKATATPAIGMVSGDTLTGITTGTSTTVAGAASADTFRIKTAARPLAIYRYQLSNSVAVGTLSATIRGLSQSAGVIGTGDNSLGTATGTGVPATPRVSQWYGFGKQEELYYRVTGAASSTAYNATLSDTTVAPIVAGSTVTEGNILIARAAGNTTDTDFWVYDGNFNPIATFGQDDPISPATGLTRAFAPGTYYLAISNFNLANNQPNPADDNFRTSSVADFPDIVVQSSTLTNQNVGVTFTSSNAPGLPVTVAATKVAAFDVVFIQFTVTPNTVPTSPAGAGTNTAGTICNSTSNVLNFRVAVTGGQNPASTGIAVTADLSGLGGSATSALNDGGINGDSTAGDGTYSADYTLAAGAPVGPATPTFAISDAQARTGSGSFSVINVVSPATPPVVVGDLGDLSLPAQVTRTFDLPALGVQWYSFTLSAPVSSGSGTFLDIDTIGTAGCPDTEIGLFSANNCGSFITTDDDTGPGNLSQLSFGSGPRPAPVQGSCGSPGVPYAGGVTLPPGTYYVAVGMFNTNFSAPYTATSTSGPAATSVVLNLRSTVSPSNPSGTGLATPSTVINDGTGSANLRVTVTPGSFPTSAGHTVTVNAAAIGAGTVTLLDDGVGPDAVAGDLIFNSTATVASGTAVGSTPLPFTITSSDARVGSGNIALTVREPSGACCVGGTATIQTASACATAGGTFLGDGSSAVGSGTLFTSANTFPIAILDNAPATPVTSTITIVSAATISSGLNVRIGLTHTWVGDLIATLSDGTTSVILIGRPGVVAGGSTVGFNVDLAGVYNFSDLATQSITAVNTVLTPGDYLPTGTGVTPIASFNGSPAAGTWTLTISDNAGSDIGTINSFAIEVNPVGCAPACLADLAGGPTGGPDGIVDGSDFIAFINAFAAGC